MQETDFFQMKMPELTDAVDIRDINSNTGKIDHALLAGLYLKKQTGNSIGDGTQAGSPKGWAPYFEIKNNNETDVVVTDENYGGMGITYTVEAGKTFRKNIGDMYPMNFTVADNKEVEFAYYVSAQEAIDEIAPSGGGVTSVTVQGYNGSHITATGSPITSSGTITLDVAAGYSIPSTEDQSAWNAKLSGITVNDGSADVLVESTKLVAGTNVSLTPDATNHTITIASAGGGGGGDVSSVTMNGTSYLPDGSGVVNLGTVITEHQSLSGLQTELSASNKLDPAYIAYDSTYAAVSASEKATYAGKQSAIDSNNKLSSDLVDDTNATNLFVTSSEKSTWSGKQNAIDSGNKLSSDLVDDTNATNLFVTSSEKTAWSGKQDAIDNSHKLSADNVDDTNTTNKFVTSTDKSNWDAKLSGITVNNGSADILVGSTKLVAGTNVALTPDATNHTITIDSTGGSGGGSVDSITIGGGSTTYTPDANGNVDLPAYPTTLPASDVHAWAKASTKPSYSYSEISGTPTLGTAAGKDVPSSGNALSSQVVMGNDSRLTDSRTPTSHSHDASAITSGTLDSARIPTATSSTKGGVYIGNNISVSSGTISLSSTNVTNALGFTPADSSSVSRSSFTITKYNANITIAYSKTWACNGLAYLSTKITSSSNISADTNTILAYMQNAYKPFGVADNIYLLTAVASIGSQRVPIMAFIKGGDQYIYVQSTVAIPANSNIFISGSYPYAL